MSLDSSLHTKLAATTTVTDLVGSRIYLRWIKSQDPLPIVTFQRISTTPLQTSGGNATTGSVDFQIDCWAATQVEARTLADAVSAALRGWTGTDPVTGPWRLTQDRNMEEDATTGASFGMGRVSQDYTVFVTL